MQDLEDEIREIKREIIESRGLTIKTGNLVNALAADMKSIAKRQTGYERRLNWNSAAAYVLFATLAFVGLKLASDARIREMESEHSDLKARLHDIERELSEQMRRAERREHAEQTAAVYYEQIRNQKRAEVVAGFDNIKGEELSKAEAAFFRDTVERFRLDLSVQSFQQGLELLRTERFAEAANAFQEALRLKDDASHIPAVKYNLARALKRLGRQGEAIVLAQAVVNQDTDRDLQDDALFVVADCAEELGRLDDARNALRQLMRRWPRSALALDARTRVQSLTARIREQK